MNVYEKYHPQSQFKGDPKLLLPFQRRGGGEYTGAKSAYGLINASLILHTQPPTPDSYSENEKQG